MALVPGTQNSLSDEDRIHGSSLEGQRFSREIEDEAE
jgi:hypothetical protein